MIRAAVLLLSVIVSIGLVHAFGLWTLPALFTLMLATLLTSTQALVEAEPAPRAMRLSFENTSAAKL